MATAILKGILNNIEGAVTVDDGYVEFEAIGENNYLGEKSHTRGANSTSIDAIMVGKKNDGSNILILIEWKFYESCPKCYSLNTDEVVSGIDVKRKLLKR